MKIALVLPHSVEEYNIRTIKDYSKHEGYEYRYARMLTELGHEVTVYYLSHRDKAERFRHEYGYEIVLAPITFGFGTGRQISFPLLDIIGKDKPDVVHVLSYYALEYDLLALWCKLRGIPLVSQYHSGGRLLNYLLRFPFLFFTIHLSKVLYTRPQEKQNLDWLLAEAEFLPNWVDETVFKNLNLRRELNSILFIGNVWGEERKYYKGYDVLQDAFKKAKKQVPSMVLHEYGKGTKAGYISPAKLVKAYNTVELCVIPSRIEPFSLVALEALSCGCPAIITSSFGVSPILRKYGYKLITAPGDSSMLSKTITDLLTDKRLQKQQVAAGRRAIHEVFNKNKIGKRLVSIYSEIQR